MLSLSKTPLSPTVFKIIIMSASRLKPLRHLLVSSSEHKPICFFSVPKQKSIAMFSSVPKHESFASYLIHSHLTQTSLQLTSSCQSTPGIRSLIPPLTTTARQTKRFRCFVRLNFHLFSHCHFDFSHNSGNNKKTSMTMFLQCHSICS